MNILERLSNILAAVACAALVAVMLVTFVDVIGRYFFAAPLTYAVELIRLGVGVAVLGGLAMTTLQRGHIAVDLVERLVPQTIQRLLVALAGMCGAVFIGLIAWQLFNRAMDFRAQGLATDILFLPVWPVVLFMSLAATVAALVALWQVMRPAARVETSLEEYD